MFMVWDVWKLGRLWYVVLELEGKFIIDCVLDVLKRLLRIFILGLSLWFDSYKLFFKNFMDVVFKVR